MIVIKNLHDDSLTFLVLCVASHTLMVLSELADMIIASEMKFNPLTGEVCPLRVYRGFIDWASHCRIVLSSECKE